MSIREAVVLGVIQGLTEFLPISSTVPMRSVPAPLLAWLLASHPIPASIRSGRTSA